MLEFGECFLIILKKEDGNHSVLNSFFPEESDYDPHKVQRLYYSARQKLSQWYYTYYRDYDAQLALAVGKRLKEGNFEVNRII